MNVIYYQHITQTRTNAYPIIDVSNN